MRPPAEALESPIIAACDVTPDGQLEAVFVVSDEARSITGNVCYVDAGYHVTG